MCFCQVSVDACLMQSFLSYAYPAFSFALSSFSPTFPPVLLSVLHPGIPSPISLSASQPATNIWSSDLPPHASEIWPAVSAPVKDFAGGPDIISQPVGVKSVGAHGEHHRHRHRHRSERERDREREKEKERERERRANQPAVSHSSVLHSLWIMNAWLCVYCAWQDCLTHCEN